GMVANNSSGTHSLVYGKTVNHVLELKVVLADGSIIELRALDEPQLDAKCRQGGVEGEGYRIVRRLAAGHAEGVERRYPKILRHVGGYNLDRFCPGTQPWNLASFFVGSEGTLGVTLEAKLRLVERPRAKVLLVVHFAELLDALAATPMILTHQPSAIE